MAGCVVDLQLQLTPNVCGGNAGSGGDGNALLKVAAEPLSQVCHDTVEQKGLAWERRRGKRRLSVDKLYHLSQTFYII